MSMPMILACATWLRRNATCNMPGNSTSSTNRACPVRSLRSSLRLIGSPKVRVDIPSTPHSFGGRHDRVDDILVAGAAAQIARQRLAYLVFAWRSVFIEKRCHRHQNTRRAVAALQAVMVVHCLLQRMIFAVFTSKTLNGRNLV